MSIMEKVFKYEGTELSVIKHEDDIWFRGKTIAEILGYSNPLNEIRKHVTLKTRAKYQNWNLNLGMSKMGTPLRIESERLSMLTNPVHTTSYFVQN